jgi:hypothetical protein
MATVLWGKKGWTSLLFLQNIKHTVSNNWDQILRMTLVSTKCLCKNIQDHQMNLLIVLGNTWGYGLYEYETKGMTSVPVRKSSWVSCEPHLLAFCNSLIPWLYTKALYYLVNSLILSLKHLVTYEQIKVGISSPWIFPYHNVILLIKTYPFVSGSIYIWHMY